MSSTSVRPSLFTRIRRVMSATARETAARGHCECCRRRHRRRLRVRHARLLEQQHTHSLDLSFSRLKLERCLHRRRLCRTH